MLEKDPKKRITLQQLKKHSFFSDVNWDDILEKKVQPPLSEKHLKNMTKALTEEETFLVFYD